MKCRACGYDGDDFDLVDETLELYLCPECSSTKIDGGDGS